MTPTIRHNGILKIRYARKPQSRGGMGDASEFCAQERDALAGAIRRARHPIERA
jgi:hypothetical protein